MRHAAAAVLLFGACTVGPARAQPQAPVFVLPGQEVKHNGPGLECRKLLAGSAEAYGAPSQAARPVIRVFNVAAVTGPLQNGFYPALISSGHTVWLPERAILLRTAANVCFVERTGAGIMRHSFKYVQQAP